MGMIVGLALVLRAAWPSRMAVEHFDEGVYASNLYSAGQEPPFVYPDRHLYAPPLLPGLLEWAMLLTGRAESVMWVNVVAGALSAAVVWWGVRSWFGPAAGLSAALLAATSEYHVAVSRMALTDVPLGLFLAAGVFAGWRAVFGGRPGWIVTAGVLAALAWWTKYNGWLTLAITGAGTVAWLLFCRERAVPATSALLRWGGTALIAVAIWAPFLWTIPDGSSYSDIRANHARYWVGLTGWWSAAERHLGILRYLDGWITCGGALLAAGACLGVGPGRFTWNAHCGALQPRHWTWCMAIALLGAVALVTAGTNIVLALGGMTCVLMLGIHAVRTLRDVSPPDAAPEPDSESAAATQLGWWMAVAWFTGLLVATPLYYPYPRLALPWIVSCWVLGSAAMVRLAQWCPISRLMSLSLARSASEGSGLLTLARRASEGEVRAGGPDPSLALRASMSSADPSLARRASVSTANLHRIATSGQVARTGFRVTSAIALLMAGLWGAAAWRGAPFLPARAAAWQERGGLRRVAVSILRDARTTVAGLGPSGRSEVDAVFYVYAEPALFFQLESAHPNTNLRFVSSPATSLELHDPAEVPVFLITGPHAHREGAERHPALERYSLVAQYDYRPSDLVRLDELPAAALSELGGPVAETVRLYLVHGPLPRR